ncbi:glycolipid transfer protein [Auriscalpium vulgare]|uniref:Glycolipid transfer protein n=1 Tax=Auriscalpium vulgare TaxID=40419 RepID=A0ACB8RR15_9AGAM|nr:glycolipid transfer protein [Auriscalpium vulgare]
MAPQFETVKSFVDVPVTDDGVETASFLEAADGLMNLFDLLGGAVFGFVQTDLRNNIAGVRERYVAHIDKSGTLESLVISEKSEGGKYGTACLTRLIRGLAFTCLALQNMQEDRVAELHTCFRRSYDVVLKHHHSFVVRSVVTLAIRAVPYRNDFYTKIAEGGDVEKLDAEMTKWLVALDVIVKRITAFLTAGGYGRV